MLGSLNGSEAIKLIQTKTIDGLLLREMVIAGTALLEKNRETVDALNVFPVPDGDTGTNMSLTMTSALRELNAKEYNTACSAADAMSKGALRGARGNSGVITSQILRGFAKSLNGAETINPVQFANALKRGSETAYKAVMKPKEGTILTVARVIGDEAVRQAAEDPEDFDALFNVILKSGEAILARTPDMLPVLKQAGVVDAGGRGLLYILTGFYAAMKGEEPDRLLLSDHPGETSEEAPEEEEESPFTYAFSFTLSHIHETVTEESLTIFRRQLNRIGQNVQAVRENDRISCSLNTNDPGKALQYGLDIGEILDCRLLNRKEERRAKNPPPAAEAPAESPAEKRPYGFVSVSLGAGFAEIFRALKVDVIVDGGQTMNPSIENLQQAAESICADTVFILPNNGNVILAAQQAAELSDRDIRIIPTKNVAMGIAALVAFQNDADADTNVAIMEKASQAVRTGTITYAVRDSDYEGLHIAQGDIIGLTNGKITYKSSDVSDVAMKLMKDIVTEDDSLITIYYGSDIREEEAGALRDRLGEEFPDCDVEVYLGGQPLYYYIISVE